MLYEKHSGSTGKHHKPGIKAKFVLLSLIGIFMFFVPVPSNGATTIPIEYLVSFLTGHFMAAGRLYALAVILIATAMPFIKKTWNKDAITTIFTFTKILGAVFTVIVFSGVGPEPIMRADHGPSSSNRWQSRWELLFQSAPSF